MPKVEFKDIRMSSVMKFTLCDKYMRKGNFTDVYGREIENPAQCNLPENHSGPCANVEYTKIEYNE